jgi:S-adenosylmethionine-dependent methyltransferase
MRPFIEITPEAADSLRDSIINNHISLISAGDYLDTEEGKSDIHQNMFNRLDEIRRDVIPWIDGVCPLDGARVLEMGCGTGIAVVALAEQGAEVTGVELSEASLAAARDRVACYGLTANLSRANAVEARDRFRGMEFDVILFYASLEHMTCNEKIESLRSAWSMLRPGKFLCVVDTPNRLWHFDNHSAMLPFFHWLPDDLAMDYARLSPRRSLRERFAEGRERSVEDICRYGRSLGFHEFDLALGDSRQLDVVSSRLQFESRRNRRFRARRLLARIKKHIIGDMFYEEMLQKLYPGLHPGFFDEYIEIFIKKH